PTPPRSLEERSGAPRSLQEPLELRRWRRAPRVSTRALSSHAYFGRPDRRPQVAQGRIEPVSDSSREARSVPFLRDAGSGVAHQREHRDVVVRGPPATTRRSPTPAHRPHRLALISGLAVSHHSSQPPRYA